LNKGGNDLSSVYAISCDISRLPGFSYAQSGELKRQNTLTEARERGLEVPKSDGQILLDMTSYLAETYRSGGYHGKAESLYQLVYDIIQNKDGAHGADFLQSKLFLE
jgi:hypothetical protein